MNDRHPHSPVVEDAPASITDRARESPGPRRRWPWFLGLLVIAAIVAHVLFLRPKQPGAAAGAAQAGSAAGARSRGPMVTPVVAAKAKKGDIGVYYSGLGAVTPIHTVTVHTRVDGQLMNIHYQEGDLVHEGDLLAELDPRPYQAQLTQYEGNLLRDQAALDNARIDLKRYQTLLTQNAIPEQQVATQKTTVEQDEGNVKADQGLIEATKVSLAYCRIAAPITGRVGLRLVDPGNIVHASDSTGLVVITQIKPISVIFTLAEQQIPAVYKKMRSGQRLRVDAYGPVGKEKLATGWLTTLDNQIDPTTGTVKLRATFDNRDNSLFPNQFTNVRLLVEQKYGVTLVPTAVIQRNSQMAYVYLVKPDSTVTIRAISVGTTEGDETEVTSGIAPGDVLVMTGVDRLQEGSKVVVHFGEAAPGPASGPSGGPQTRTTGQIPVAPTNQNGANATPNHESHQGRTGPAGKGTP